MTTKSRAESYLWLAIAVIAVTMVAFTGGYYVGMSATTEEKSITIVDDYGRTVRLDGVPERIVSTAPTPTEILFAVGAGPQVVGVDNYSDYPAEAASLPKVGAYPLNTEVIVALQPDLIVSSDLVSTAQLDLLEDQGIPYVILAARTLDDVMKDIRLAGIVTGHVDQADQLARSLEQRIDAVTNKTLALDVVKPMVYLEYFPFWTFGPGSFGNDLIALAGGTNIAENTSSEYPMVASEFVIAQNPEIIIYTVGVMTSTTAADIAERPGWQTIDAVQENKIYSIDDNLTSRYGPRIVDGLEQLAEMLHPELFR